MNKVKIKINLEERLFIKLINSVKRIKRANQMEMEHFRRNPGFSTGDDVIINEQLMTTTCPTSDPRSVMQYSWITASAESGPYGFEKPNRIYAAWICDITFPLTVISVVCLVLGKKIGVD